MEVGEVWYLKHNGLAAKIVQVRDETVDCRYLLTNEWFWTGNGNLAKEKPPGLEKAEFEACLISISRLETQANKIMDSMEPLWDRLTVDEREQMIRLSNSLDLLPREPTPPNEDDPNEDDTDEDDTDEDDASGS